MQSMLQMGTSLKRVEMHGEERRVQLLLHLKAVGDLMQGPKEWMQWRFWAALLVVKEEDDEQEEEEAEER